MGKISLVLADTDKEYVTSLENYLLVNYSKRFDIYSFTEPGAIPATEGNALKADILLAGTGFSEEFSDKFGGCTKIRLSENIFVEDASGYAAIDKFRHADKIVADIINIFSQKSGSDKSPRGYKKTSVVSVFSASGGCGKSSIAAGCSVLSADRGLDTFYLNLEGVPSTNMFFNSTADRGFSDIVYYLKEKKENLTMRLEGIRCADPQTGVHFFFPQDNSAEVYELLPEDVKLLIESFKSQSLYDLLFVDTGGFLDRTGAELMKLSDSILVVCGPDEVSKHKTNIFLKELEISDKKYSLDLKSKILLIRNRWSQEEMGNPYDESNAGRSFIISESKKLNNTRGIGRFPDSDPELTSSLSLIVDALLERKQPESSRESWQPEDMALCR